MATIRTYLGVIGFCAAAILAPRMAHATGEACTNDIDCKTGAACGGEICDWTQGMKCEPATAAGSGREGWCTVDTDCKCKAQGATCVKLMFQCTKTVDGSTAGGGASGTGGGPGTAGTTSATGGTTSATGGTTSATGGTSSGPTTTPAAGTSSSSDSSSSSGGCAMTGGAPRGSLAFAFGAACALGLAGARRRRRAA